MNVLRLTVTLVLSEDIDGLEKEIGISVAHGLANEIKTNGILPANSSAAIESISVRHKTILLYLKL